MPLGFRFGRPFSRIFSSVSAATLASSCATAAKRLTTRDRSSAAERSSRLGNSERIIMPPSTHNSRRSGIPLSQFAAPVSPAPVPQVFENSHGGDVLRFHRLAARIDAHPLQHADQALLGEGGIA